MVTILVHYPSIKTHAFSRTSETCSFFFFLPSSIYRNCLFRSDLQLWLFFLMGEGGKEGGMDGQMNELYKYACFTFFFFIRRAYLIKSSKPMIFPERAKHVFLSSFSFFFLPTSIYPSIETVCFRPVGFSFLFFSTKKEKKASMNKSINELYRYVDIYACIPQYTHKRGK